MLKKFYLTLAIFISTQFSYADSSDKNKKYSTIKKSPNEQLVEVGERNKFELDYKKINLGANLFRLPSNVLSVSASYAVFPNVAARIGATLDFSKSHDKTQLNFGVPIYFQKMYTGYFVEPGIDSNAGFYTMLGHHWIWDSGFNLFCGIGGGKKGVTGYLQVGYAI